MSKLEELKKKYDQVSHLWQESNYKICKLYQNCVDCPLNNDKEHCLNRKIAERKDELLAKLSEEERKEATKKLIEEQAKTREDMTKAMLKVKHDDWDIVNITYAEDDTTAVAFIKKGTELKRNMELIRHYPLPSIMSKTIAKIEKAMDRACFFGDFFATRKKVYDVLGIKEDDND